MCLDDKPLPKRYRIITKDSLPPAKPGEAANEPGVAEKKVDPDVYRAFALSERVDVIVSLRGESLPESGGRTLTEMRARNELREQAERQLQDRVLSTVSADEFWLWGRLGQGMSGSITKEGLQRLWRNPDVQRVYLQQIYRIPEENLGRPGPHRPQ